jgi:hypothetical protein
MTSARRLATFALLGLTASCAGSSPVVHGSPDAEWTLLVYMAADDDLEQAAIENVVEMAEVGSTGPVNVIIQIDRAAATKNGRGFTRAPLINLPDFNTTKRLRVDRGKVLAIADLGETNTGDPDALAGFITWGLTTFPAKKTALVLWDHGGATRGFGWDITNDDKPLSIVDARRGIVSGLLAAGRQKLDVIGFDACLMANLGVAYELRHLADVFIGSEEVEPAHGWSYAPLVRAMATNASPEDVAKEVVKSFEAACRQAKTIDFCTLAAFDTSKLEAVTGSVDALGDRIRQRSKTPSDWFPVAKARVSAEEYGAETGESSPFSTVDAVDFATGAARLLGETNGVADAMQAATIVRFHGRGKPHAHGMSLTFPRHSKDKKAVDAALELATHPRWQGLIDGFVDFTEADKTPPRVDAFVADVGKEKINIHASVLGDDVAEAAAVVGTADAKGVLTLLSIAVLPLAPTTHELSFDWKRTLPFVTDGQTVLPVTMIEQEPYPDESGELVQVVSIAGAFHPHGVAANRSDVVLYLKVPAHGASTVVGLYHYADGGRAGEIQIHEDDRFAPKVRTTDSEGQGTWTASAQTLALGDRARLQLVQRPATAGAYAIGFRVTDYAANRHLQTTTVTVP